jgi:hypothetical protein
METETNKADADPMSLLSNREGQRGVGGKMGGFEPICLSDISQLVPLYEFSRNSLQVADFVTKRRSSYVVAVTMFGSTFAELLQYDTTIIQYDSLARETTYKWHTVVSFLLVVRRCEE